MRNGPVCEDKEKQQTWIHCRDILSHLFITLVISFGQSLHTFVSVCDAAVGQEGTCPVSVAAT